MWTFSCPNIVYGDQALGYISRMGGRMAFIISDIHSVNHGLVRRVTDRLDKAGIAWQLFDPLPTDTFSEAAEWAIPAAAVYQPDWVIGLGDASCLDTAKAVVEMLSRSDVLPEGMVMTGTQRFSGKAARLMAIPISGGNGSGADAISSILFTNTGPGQEWSGSGWGCQPDVAILDPEMIVDMTPQVTADLGMDTLCRAVEGYVSTWGSAITDGNGLIAAKQVFTYLPKAYDMCDYVDANMELLYAAVLAGLCFGHANAGLGHSVGHALATVYKLPLGRATGLMLPYTMEYLINGSLQTTVKFAEIARYCGAVARKDIDCARALVKMIRALAKQVEQPLCIRDMGVDGAAFEADLPRLVEVADHAGLEGMVRRAPGRTDLGNLFRCAYSGLSVGF